MLSCATRNPPFPEVFLGAARRRGSPSARDRVGVGPPQGWPAPAQSRHKLSPPSTRRAAAAAYGRARNRFPTVTARSYGARLVSTPGQRVTAEPCRLLSGQSPPPRAEGWPVALRLWWQGLWEELTRRHQRLLHVSVRPSVCRQSSKTSPSMSKFSRHPHSSPQPPTCPNRAPPLPGPRFCRINV